eukprot:14532614-Alexandrium_andersonii.AAC.1
MPPLAPVAQAQHPGPWDPELSMGGGGGRARLRYFAYATPCSASKVLPRSAPRTSRDSRRTQRGRRRERSR